MVRWAAENAWEIRCWIVEHMAAVRVDQRPRLVDLKDAVAFIIGTTDRLDGVITVGVFPEWTVRINPVILSVSCGGSSWGSCGSGIRRGRGSWDWSWRVLRRCSYRVDCGRLGRE